ncbi:endonuclease VII domain-containing protein [Agrobacterium salinitolerans]|uniref:endonuclease VII domain-containing protein n=1 Tax=Agrobacterium salinitolerans TaxID=1183413 RepID=UPI0022B84993|nr:endonuclease VII domain-containing protein [Agrobacterium salinitolerans]MCZ7974387.1 endonuclease VII domain-containing protein [Agrobacterium salinitolerans]
MRYGSVCSGIEAATIDQAKCWKCLEVKPVDQFHKQKTAKSGHHVWCRKCFNSYARQQRNSRVSPETKRKWNISSRYGLTPDDVERMLTEQEGLCAICREVLPVRYHIDHCHSTNKVRGILCHGCNLKLPIVERPELLAAAIAYLEKAKT